MFDQGLQKNELKFDSNIYFTNNFQREIVGGNLKINIDQINKEESKLPSPGTVLRQKNYVSFPPK